MDARHTYLYCQDERGSTDLMSAPSAAEIKAMAKRAGRRWLEGMREVERVWKLEQGSTGREYRDNRMEYIRENPAYPAGAEAQSIFG